jgi:glycosyltransferase involved in cell wall biosynthesis
MKADLHLHSTFSRRPPEWLFRKLGVPDSASDPRKLYDLLRRCGMDLVTLTDHDTLDGCLEIAGLPGVFLSEQVTATFPEERFSVQVLVWGLNETQHRELQPLRANIRELQAYLASENLAHGIAHPLYHPQTPPTPEIVEKLLLLFPLFESLNGHRDALWSRTLEFLLENLTPDKIHELADRHGICPTHPEPWKKFRFGGSDDHSGVFPGRAFTEVPGAKSAEDFLLRLRNGTSMPRGEAGTPLSFSHGLYNTLRLWIAEKFPSLAASGPVAAAWDRFIEGRNPTEFSWTEKLGFLAHGVASGQFLEWLDHRGLYSSLAADFGGERTRLQLATRIQAESDRERRAFQAATFLASQLAFRSLERILGRIQQGNLLEAIREASLLLPAGLALAPYFYGFTSQNPNRARLRSLCKTVCNSVPDNLQKRRRAWFTDTLDDINGVATTIQKLTAACNALEMDLLVVTSRSQMPPAGIPVRNFEPVGEFALPEYELQKLSFPPVLEMVDFIQQGQFTEILISTPGPVGLTGLLAAKLLGIPSAGIYHTDFPQYVRILTEDAQLETLTWSYMRGFYGALDLLYVNSECYRSAWIQRGIAPSKIKILPRGLDTDLFHPSKKDPGFWQRRGASPSLPVLLYVGRVSREKNLDLLVAAWRALAPGSAVLAIVGDGPHLADLQQAVPEAIFTGYLSGTDLAAAYASADLFVFPSTTDTYGNVVVEALASGLPCVVSDEGGPKDLVHDGRTGRVTRAHDPGDFLAAIQWLLENPGLRAGMAEEARAAVHDRSWQNAARAFWDSPWD